MGRICFPRQSIEIQVVPLDRFCCPITPTIAVQNLCTVLLSHFFGRLHEVTLSFARPSQWLRSFQDTGRKRETKKLNKSKPEIYNANVSRQNWTYSFSKERHEVTIQSKCFLLLHSCAFCATIRLHPNWKNPSSEFLATSCHHKGTDSMPKHFVETIASQKVRKNIDLYGDCQKGFPFAKQTGTILQNGDCSQRFL